MDKTPFAAAAATALLIVAPWSAAGASPQDSSAYFGRYRPVVGTRGMVVADDGEAAQWGAEILRRGGNAVDAAVATAFALAVTRHQFASLGGGGFLLYCPHPKDGSAEACEVIDYREQAPAAAKPDMYLRDGKARGDLSQDGALASGVPGVVAGLTLARERHGRLPLKDLLSRPISLAQDGVRFTGYGEEVARGRWAAFNGPARAVFGCKRGDDLQTCAPGALIRQPDLARVLQEISRRGSQGFYEGWVAKAIVEGLSQAGGIITVDDLKAYRPKVRKPLTGTFAGLEVVTMPPPSSGGAILLQLLAYAELADKAGAFAQGYGSAASVHAIAHAMALGFADRSLYFGDPDFVTVPLGGLLSPRYLRERWKAKIGRAHV
jgi:gamma-glutamyltranspeptidase/glutathione hydrolase